MGYLIDTSVFIAWERQRLDSAALVARVGAEPVALSVVTASELLHGVHRAETAQRRGKREEFVEAILSAMPVVPIDLAIARTHARIWADLAARGSVIGAHDLLIAATALTHDLVIATRNVREFARIESVRVEVW
jgi:tRNA(fMet)-specific endonuclease VapC